jgi:signal transduction histidine kinase
MTVVLALAAGAAAGAFGAFWLLRFRWVLPLEKRARLKEREASSARSLLSLVAETADAPASTGLLRDRLAQLLAQTEAMFPGLRLWLFERGSDGAWSAAAERAGGSPVGEAAAPAPEALEALPQDGKPAPTSEAARRERGPAGFFKAVEASGYGAASLHRGGPDCALVACAARVDEPAFDAAADLLDAVGGRAAGLMRASRRLWALERREKELKDSMSLTIQELTATNVRLAQRSREMKTLFEVASTLTSNPSSPRSSLASLVSIIAKALEADLCAFLLLDEAKQELVTQPGAYGIAGDEGSLYRIPLSKTEASSVRTFLSGEPFLTGDAQNDPRTLGAYARLWKAHSLMVVPLRVEGKPIGVLRIGSFKKDQFNEDQLRFAGLIAQEAAVIIESAMLYQQVAQTAKQLADLNRLKDDFISTVSHELKTPLTSIQGFLAVLLSGDAGDLDEQQTRFISIAKNAANRLGLLIGDLLDLSRLEGGVEMKMEETSLAELARHSIELHAPQARESGVELAAAWGEDPPKVWADGKWLLQVVDNLVSNALKFTPRGGSVAVSLEGKGDMVMATVSDTGIGISDRHKDKIFEKFYRVRDNPSFSPPGTGLGLAIAKFVVETHHGKIWVESEPGRGSKFHFVVPTAHSPADREEREVPRGNRR